MNFSKRKLIFVPFFYEVIVLLANLWGILIPHFFNPIYANSYNVEEWEIFVNSIPLYGFIQFVIYVLPVVLCVSYGIFAIRKRRSFYVNLPVVFSTMGICGWIIYIIYEICLWFYAGIIGYALDYKPFFLSLLMNILQTISTFSLSYFLISTIHKRFVLPCLYPNGKISKEKGVFQPTITFLFVINYISVTLFPVQLLLFFYDPSSPERRRSIFILLFIMIIGIIITYGLVITFKNPLKQIKKSIEKIKEGDYSSRMNFVSNDLFGELSDTMDEMTESIQEKTQKIIEIQNSIITGMATMVESRDNSTGGHIKRTSECVRVFSEYLRKQPAFSNVDDEFFVNIIKAAPMHDLGKISVMDAILQKPGKFSDSEYEMMKTHSKEGARIVNEVLCATDDEDFKKIAVNVAHYHHEKWNGTGYPEKISGEQIPIEARIMALADVFDALVSKRCYKESFSYDKAFEIIQDSLGTHFDPELGKEFIKCRASLEALYDGYLK